MIKKHSLYPSQNETGTGCLSKLLWSHIRICSRHNLKSGFHFGTGIYTAVFLGFWGISGVSHAEIHYTPTPISGGAKTTVISGSAGSTGSLLLLSYGFRPTAVQSSILTESGSDLVMTMIPTSELTEATVAALEGKLLNFPNPFQAESGTTIGYILSKNMDVELKIFDMMGNLVSSIEKPAGAMGGLWGLNKVPINQSNFGGTILSAGVYFYLLINNGKILGKGKMAVIPSGT